MQEQFRKCAEIASKAAGSPWGFCIAVTLVLAWAVSGPIFEYSDTWQLVINTCTTIVTFMMVFLIQNAQNKDSLTLQLKLDELLCAVRGARVGMIDLDQLTEADLATLRRNFQQLAHAKGGSKEPVERNENPTTGNAP